MRNTLVAVLLSAVALTGCSAKLNRDYKCVKTTDGKTIVEIVDRKKCKGKGK